MLVEGFWVSPCLIFSLVEEPLARIRKCSTDGGQSVIHLIKFKRFDETRGVVSTTHAFLGGRGQALLLPWIDVVCTDDIPIDNARATLSDGVLIVLARSLWKSIAFEPALLRRRLQGCRRRGRHVCTRTQTFETHRNRYKGRGPRYQVSSSVHGQDLARSGRTESAHCSRGQRAATSITRHDLGRHAKADWLFVNPCRLGCSPQEAAVVRGWLIKERKSCGLQQVYMAIIVVWPPQRLEQNVHTLDPCLAIGLSIGVSFCLERSDSLCVDPSLRLHNEACDVPSFFSCSLGRWIAFQTSSSTTF